MVGTSDSIGMTALSYARRYGHRAHFRVDDDISAAVGQHRWDTAHVLNRVKLRLIRMQLVGRFDDRVVASGMGSTR